MTGYPAMMAALRIGGLLGLVLVGAGGVAALGGGCVAPPPDAVRVVVGSAPDSLDPRFATGAIGVRLSQLLAPPLCVVDEALRPTLTVADAIDVVDDVTVDVHVRPGLTVVADDVVFTFASMMDPAVGSPHRGRLDMVKDVGVVTGDDGREVVRFRLKGPHAPFVVDVVCAFGVVSRAACADDGGRCRTHPVGAGPFVRVDDGGRPDHLRLERVGGAAGPPLEIQIMRDGTARLMALVAGDVDVVVGDVAPWDVAPLRAAGVDVEGASGVGFSYLGLNTREAPLADVRVRQAIAMATDVDGLVAGRLQGRGQPAAGLLPPGHWASDPAVKPRVVDVDGARRLLREAGVVEGTHLRLLSSTDRLRQSTARVVQQQLARVGLVVDVEVRDWSVVYEALKAGRFELVLAKWTPVVEPDLLTLTVHSKSIPRPGVAGGNRGAFVDHDVDAWLDAARATTDVAARTDLYRRVEARLRQQVPFVPLWFDDEVIASGPRVRAVGGGALRPWRTGSFLPLLDARLVATPGHRTTP